MDVVITINEKDLLKNPDILDVLKGFAKALKEPTAVCAEVVHTEPVEEHEETVEKQEAVVEKVQESPAEPEAPVEQAAEENKEEPQVTLEELRAIIAKVSKKHGVEKAKGILHKFGVTNLSALDAKHYAAALKEAEGAL